MSKNEGNKMTDTDKEEAPDEAEIRHHSIFKIAVEGSFKTDPDGRFIAVNDTLAKMLGYKSASELKKIDACQLFIGKDSRKKLISMLETRGIVTDFENKVRCRDRSIIWVSENVRTIINSKGEIEGYEGLLIDITRRKLAEKIPELHKGGKISISSRIRIDRNLPYVYTPGVADVVQMLKDDPKKAYQYTIKSNSVAIVSDCSRVLGFGKIGAIPGLTVMEGKALLFKKIADIDAFPICLDTNNCDEIINTVKCIAPSFGGINLEDIASPQCFKIQDKLIEYFEKSEYPIPVCHNDQYGTAVVVLAALRNALKLIEMNLHDAKIVFIGCGAAGYACFELLSKDPQGPMDLKNVEVFHEVNEKSHSKYKGQPKVENIHEEAPNRYCMNPNEEIVAKCLRDRENLTIEEALVDANVVIGLAKGEIITEKMIKKMDKNKSIVFALANSVPEIDYIAAKRAGAKVVATALSGTPNQINDVLSMPSIFRGILDVGAPAILDEDRKILFAAVDAIEESVEKRDENHIIPLLGRSSVVAAIAKNVALQATKTFGDRCRNESIINNEEEYYNSLLKRITPF
jgi:PAS domain S-box